MPMTNHGFTEPDNEDRADFANDAVAVYFERTRPADPYPEEIGTLNADDREALEEVLRDLLCDLRHWADVTGIDFEMENDMAMGHYDEERAEEREADALLVTGFEGAGKGFRIRREATESLTGGAE